MKEDLLYELTIEDENDFIYAISMVTEPAIESNWIYFGKEKIQLAKLDDEKRLVLGAILIPNKNILRLDGEGNPYHVFIKPETIKRLSEIYLEKKYTDAVTIEHQRPVDDITLVESWIVEDTKRDKSAVYGLSLPKGTWAGTMHVKNEKVWNDYVKTGILSGFSIEGIFSHQLVKNSKQPDYLQKQISDLDEQEALLVLSKIEALLESYSDYGEGIRNNAKRGIELNEKNGNKCATQVGKVRAQQIANGEKLSVDTIKRMYSYLSRAETYYDNADENSDCGYISYLLWGGKAALGYSKNKLKELGILEEGEQPSIPNSTYPGQAASGSIAPATFAAEGCPEATQNIEVNLKGRQNAIDTAQYGPLNPNEPNEDYWKAKADQFKGDVETAKKSLCGNCSFFVQTKAILDCIAAGINDTNAWDTIDAGDLGYCEAFDFKCASNRTCAAWVSGGPITD